MFNDYQLKLIDMGLSCYIVGEKVPCCFGGAGTSYFEAPEYSSRF